MPLFPIFLVVKNKHEENVGKLWIEVPVAVFVFIRKKHVSGNLGIIYLVRTQNFPKNEYFLAPDT